MAQEIDSKAIGAAMLAVIDKAMSDLKSLGLSHASACQFLGMHAVFQADEDLTTLEAIQDEATQALEAYGSSEGETLQ